MITASDFFCGAGGSSSGLVAAGVEVRHAANHWQRAIETHQTNHPRTEHSVDDLQQAHASLYPHTTIAWFSPECTNHSLSKGRKRKNAAQLDLWGETALTEDEIRSRATMREVVEFTEYHRYEIVIVENVVDIRYWEHFDDWWGEMRKLGYLGKILYLNSMFFGVPQSRDRFYAVFWKKGNKAPDLDFRPMAVCPEHGIVGAVQAWKKPERVWGRYGGRRQYVYRCPHCGAEVKPPHVPAAAVIDWTIPSERIGDREKPLKPRTIERIRAGLKKFGYLAHVDDLGHIHAAHNGKVYGVDGTLPTQTTRHTLALTDPFITSQHDGRNPLRSLEEPLWCVTSMNNEQQLVVPSFLIQNNHTGTKDGITNPIALGDPLRTLTTGEQQALIASPFMVLLHGWVSPIAMERPLHTLVAAGSQHALITPFVVEMRNRSTARGVEEPFATITGSDGHHALVMSYYNNTGYSNPDKDTLPVITTLSRHALVEADVDALLPECGFRMLTPEELKLGMAFEKTYIITGNKREQVKQVGNAVTPPVAQAIAQRCVESLAG